MRKIITLLSFLALFISGEISAQTSTCVITITPMDTTICPGDSVFIQATANILGAGQAFNFNAGNIPPGWSAAGGTAFSAPCGPNPTNSPYYWASTAGSGQPGIFTSAFDISCGGVITFDMVYAVQGGAAPCEGPDLANEGVSLQYSTDGGTTWFDIIYYSPGGFSLPSMPASSAGVLPPGNITPYTSWSSFNVPIPSAALSTTTQFRWIQFNSSGTCCDNWGIDNVVINATGPPCGTNAVVNWSNGLNDTLSFWGVPVGDTTFVAFVYDTVGNFQCQSDTVFVDLFDGNFTYSLPNTTTVYCPDDSALVSVTNVQNALLPVSYDWSTGSTISSSYLNAAGTTPDTLMYYVDVTDGCGFVVGDSVQLVVNQTLRIDTMTTVSQVNCAPNGSAQGIVAGNIGPINYSWTGPGSSGTYSSNSSIISSVPTGWYYLTVTDNVCSVSDSVFIDSVNVDNLTYNLVDSAFLYCPTDSAQVQVTGITNATLPMTYNWSTGSTTNSTYLPTNGNEQETIVYYVTFNDACGLSRTDSVVLVVNKLLNIDSLFQRPTTTCNFDGEVAGFISGSTGTPQYLWQEYIDFNNPGAGGSTTTSTWNNIGTGWYYFTVTDDVCSDVDSIYLDLLDPPIASFTASPQDGCAGMFVSFTNNSQNTNNYYWDFGNGNTQVTSTMNGYTQQYNNSGQVMLIAYLDNSQTCSDTAYIDISVVECGCTDPLAINYNPLAIVDDGSCIYPIPVVNAPNIFTPNGDGSNDLFFFTTIYTVQLEVTILNRWGNLMYEETIPIVQGAPPVGWDGKSPNNTDAQEGTYFYKYKATGINGDEVSGQGFLQLVRQ